LLPPRRALPIFFVTSTYLPPLVPPSPSPRTLFPPRGFRKSRRLSSSHAHPHEKIRQPPLFFRPGLSPPPPSVTLFRRNSGAPLPPVSCIPKPLALPEIFQNVLFLSLDLISRKVFRSRDFYPSSHLVLPCRSGRTGGEISKLLPPTPPLGKFLSSTEMTFSDLSLFSNQGFSLVPVNGIPRYLANGSVRVRS